MRSFSILRTNVGLTTNVKLMVSGEYNLYLESIDSDPKLSSSKYKKFAISSESYYDESLPLFYNGLPKSTAYSVSSSVNNTLSIDTAMSVKYDGDNDIMFTSFENQFDDIYQMGCRNIIDNKNYNEEYECFAPLYIGNDGVPEKFIILRIDGPGLIELNKNNFRNNIIDNFKCVTIFDLSKNTPVGKWLDKNFVSNPNFPVTPFYMDFRDLEFSFWNGIDYEVGGYATKPFFLNTTLEYENTYYDFENLVYDGYKNNKVVFPNIINFSFLFDDIPATPDSIRNWSINRYMGFYLDGMENSYNFSPYTLPNLRPDVVILGGNILSSPSNENPFVQNWSDITSPYIEVNGNFYQVQQYTRTYEPHMAKVKLDKNVYADEIVPIERNFYKIISDVNLQGLTFSGINSNLITISATNSGYSIYLNNGNDLIPDYDTADLWLIEIDSKHHVIKKINGIYYIQSDYGFSMSQSQFVYWINNPDPNYRKVLDLTITQNFNPMPFKVYKCNFTDIKDFDTSIVDTQYSKFEYELPLQLTHTDEPKMYVTNYESEKNPKDFDDFIIGGKVVNIPSSSEYTSNGELFRIQNNDLSPIWRKNPIRVKWGYQNSLSSNDYPYLLNNSFLSEDFNRTTNPFDPSPDRKERNLDYFYTINSSTASYSYHSLHVEKTIGSDIDMNFKFELNKYLGTASDYFSYFFGKTASFLNGSKIVKTNKWSTFEKGDNIVPNSTLFRGLKFDLYDVSDIKSGSVNINSINLESKNNYQGYKFSILLSENDYKVTPSPADISVGILGTFSNNLSWYVIEKWEPNKTYNINDIVSYYDILYIALTQSTIVDPNMNPSLSSDWSTTTWSPVTLVFWSPSYSYSPNDFVYNNGEYYYYDPSNSSSTFWEPFITYNTNNIVVYGDSAWISTTQSNTTQPGSTNFWRSGNNTYYYWEKTNTKTAWSVIELWSTVNTYTYTHDPILNTDSGSIIKPNSVINLPGKPYVVYNNILYQLQVGYSSGDIPGISPVWKRIYSMVPDTSYLYYKYDNPIIFLNNKYYQCLSTSKSSTLDDGICIYINKLFKNILVNIYINDNTLLNLSNTDRDMLYNDLYSGITALNFTSAINDISNKFGFSNYLQYVIINEDGSLNTYDFNNISQLPCILLYQAPDQLFSRRNSINITPLSLSNSQIKPKKVLNNGTITTLDQLNYYNGDSLATQVSRNQTDPSIIPNYSGLQNNIYNTLYRYSGNYCPIFYSISLFQSPDSSTLRVGNYKFDTSLSDFGLMKERVMSKINRNGTVLKLANAANINSIYPMIDEFGYTFNDYFIFKSTWDYQYYIECNNSDQNVIIASNNNILKP